MSKSCAMCDLRTYVLLDGELHNQSCCLMKIISVICSVYMDIRNKICGCRLHYIGVVEYIFEVSSSESKKFFSFFKKLESILLQ